ncbi:MAG: MetQ/NlpA family ABC transporter substrate-binding protein, partial [Eubacterium sp.]|nr:MetQ/NlpA family ABC transporter substrate-binding protein [Eubacterium sp.]
MKKKLLSLALATILTAGLVTGCGSSASSSDQSSSSQDTTQKKTITVAASQTPHSEILAEAAKILEKQGYELKVTVFDDYVQPNNVVESGEFDANYMEHV